MYTVPRLLLSRVFVKGKNVHNVKHKTTASGVSQAVLWNRPRDRGAGQGAGRGDETLGGDWIQTLSLKCIS